MFSRIDVDDKGCMHLFEFVDIRKFGIELPSDEGSLAIEDQRWKLSHDEFFVDISSMSMVRPEAPWLVITRHDSGLSELAQELTNLVTVMQAGSYDEARRLIRSHRFDIVISDCGLPKGYEEGFPCYEPPDLDRPLSDFRTKLFHRLEDVASSIDAPSDAILDATGDSSPHTWVEYKVGIESFLREFDKARLSENGSSGPTRQVRLKIGRCAVCVLDEYRIDIECGDAEQSQSERQVLTTLFQSAPLPDIDVSQSQPMPVSQYPVGRG